MRKKARDSLLLSTNDPSMCLFPDVRHPVVTLASPFEVHATENEHASTSVPYDDPELPPLRTMDPPVLLKIQNLIGTSKTRVASSKHRKMTKLANRRLALEVIRNWQRHMKPGASSPKAARRVTRASCTTIGRKRVVGVDGEGEPNELILTSSLDIAERHFSSPDRIPESSFTLFGSTFPRPNELCISNAPSTPVMQRSWTGDVRMDCGGSLLETLPLDLLVRIVCGLHHDELKPLFHTCRRLRAAVLIARQCHFDFTTPDRERQEKLGLSTPRPEDRWPFSSATEIQALVHPPTPRAPRHLPNSGHSRISVTEMRQIAATLFQGSTPHRPHTKPPSLQRSVCRGVASHRVLFYEEELCQAVAQNTI